MAISTKFFTVMAGLALLLLSACSTVPQPSEEGTADQRILDMEERLQQQQEVLDSLRYSTNHIRLKVIKHDQQLNEGSGEKLDIRLKAIDSKLQSLDEAILDLRRAPTPSPAPAPLQNTIPRDVSFEDRYDKALEYFNNNEFTIAEKMFKKLLAEKNNDKFADNCQFWIAAISYNRADYQRAIREFSKVFTYEKANKMDHAQFKIAQSYMMMGRNDAALNAFKKHLREYPLSDRKNESINFIQELQK